MRLRGIALVAATLLATAAPVACVDLFHSTDFVTLCEREPTSPSCGGEGGADAEVPEVGTDAGPPPLDFCAWTKVEARTRATRACAWLGACEGPLGENVFGPCMLHAMWAYDCDLNPTMRPTGTTRALWACLAEVKSCGEVDRCVFGDEVTQCNAVPSGTFTACGAGGASDTRVECGRPEKGPPIGVDPCRLTGRTCERLDESTGVCTGAQKKTCSAGRRCAGTSAVDCQSLGGGVVDRGLDCAAFGAGACIEKNGDVACAPNADAGSCTRDALDVRCTNDGSTALGCVDGKEIVVDCTKIGPAVACDVDTEPVPTYDPLKACADRDPAGACAVSAADGCSGNTLHSCAQGIAFTIDCTSVGLGPCEKVAGGVLARCTPP